MAANAETALIGVITNEATRTRTPECDAVPRTLEMPDGESIFLVSWLLCHRRKILPIFGMILVVTLDTCVSNLAVLFGLYGSLSLRNISMILLAL